MTSSRSHDTITPQRVARVLWRRKLVCLIVAAAVFATGAAVVLTRPKTYQSTATVALLPVSTDPNILPNYAGLIANLIPTYVQLVSSPALLNEVAATLPFTVSESQLAQDVHAQSLSNAAVINIVAQTQNPVEAQKIAARTMAVFLTKLKGNGVVVPTVYAQPVVPTTPAPPSTDLLLGVIFALAIVLGLGAGLLWDRLSRVEDVTRPSPDVTRPSPEPPHPPILGVVPEQAGQRDVSTILHARDNSALRDTWDSLKTNYMYAAAGRRVRSVAVTSLHPGQGKTTVAVNLAASLAELGLSVVLVDGAVHDPVLHKVFGLENGQGLTSVVLGDADPASLLIPVPSIAGMQLVTAGPELSTRTDARFYLEPLKKLSLLGDLVIVDSPALQHVAADFIISATDAIVLVVPSEPGWPGIVAANLSILERYRKPVLGIVLVAANGIVHENGQIRMRTAP